MAVSNVQRSCMQLCHVANTRPVRLFMLGDSRRPATRPQQRGLAVTSLASRSADCCPAPSTLKILAAASMNNFNI